MAFVNFNGKIYSRENVPISYANSAFRYGVGLIETILVKSNQLQLEELHWERLSQGMSCLHFTVPTTFTQRFIAQEILKLVARNKMERLCRVRLQVFTPQNGLYDFGDTLAFLIECFELSETMVTLNENGLVCGTIKNLFKNNDSLANLKSSNMLIYQQAAQMAKKEQWNDALICNNQGNIIESTIANIFWIEGEEIFTPPLSEGCIAGVMRQNIINSCKDKFSIHEKPFTIAHLKQANEVFLTNAISGIKWIKHVDEYQYRLNLTHKLAKQLMAIY